ncbi:MAG TPA: hypothetical protein VIN66_06885 [Rheinheimera sp.]|uniref:hypothetical protein n=1 Tax=Rheinheimera sp. TaxID=1869214 RepID=UPI002F934F57
MPITISVREFKKKTSTTFDARPTSLRCIDGCLKNYHEQVSLNAPHSEIARREVSVLLMFIQDWTAGKATVTINGQLRYKAYRDRHGMISELERQATQTEQEIERVHQGITDHLNVNLGRRHLNNFAPAPAAPPAPPRHDRLPFTYFGDKPPLPPRRGAQVPVRHSVAGTEEILDQRASFGAIEANTENMGRANRALQEHHAYKNAAHMLTLVTRRQTTWTQVQNSANVPKALTGGTLTMASLFSAMNSLVQGTGKHIYYERHCTQQQYFANILDNSSDQNPVLFAVTDNANGQSKVVICRGKHYYWDGLRQIPRYSMIDTSIGFGVAVVTMDDQGDMVVESNGQVANYIAARDLGFIKMKISP